MPRAGDQPAGPPRGRGRGRWWASAPSRPATASAGRVLVRSHDEAQAGVDPGTRTDPGRREAGSWPSAERSARARLLVGVRRDGRRGPQRRADLPPPGRRAPARPGRAPGRAPLVPGDGGSARPLDRHRPGLQVPPGQRRDAGEHRHRPPAPPVVQQHQGDVGLLVGDQPARPGAVRSPRLRRRPAPGPVQRGQHLGARPGSAATASAAAAPGRLPRCHPRTRGRGCGGTAAARGGTGVRRQGSTMAMTGPPPDRPWWTAATDTKTAGSPVTDATTPPTHDLICRCQCTSGRRA